MRTHLFLGGPVHGEARTLIDCCSGALVPIGDKLYEYRRETFIAPVTHIEYDVMVRGNLNYCTPAMIVGMLSQHGLL